MRWVRGVRPSRAPLGDNSRDSTRARLNLQLTHPEPTTSFTLHTHQHVLPGTSADAANPSAALIATAKTSLWAEACSVTIGMATPGGSVTMDPCRVDAMRVAEVLVGAATVG